MDKSFEQMVSEAIDVIPKKYQEKMKHVAILVEDTPTAEQRAKLGLRSCESLYGLYEGIPLTKRGGSTLVVQPDVITLFKYPMVELFSGENLEKQIYKTLWHEVAHFFGLNHEQIHKAERK